MTDLEMWRRFYARLVTADVGNPRVLDAFLAVPRESYLGPGPWMLPIDGGYMSTETAAPAVLYQDILIGLLPEKRINNGQPSLHAKCLAMAAPLSGERVLHIGAGTGYYTALLAHMVGQSGHVDAFEIEPELVQRAAENLRSLTNVIVHCRSALDPPLPTANVIYVNASTTTISAVWLDALAIGGRLVLPLAPPGDTGCMLLVTRTATDAYTARAFATVGFIACIGADDDQAATTLRGALEAQRFDQIRSLRRGTPSDATAWLVGDGWWLSTADA